MAAPLALKPRLKAEGGSGSVLTIAGITTLTLLGVAMLLLGQAFYLNARLSSAADQAALAAADIHRKIIGGSPCEEARKIIQAHGVLLKNCQLGRESATVTTATHILGVEIIRRSRAGAPRMLSG